jgi:hypothetical protein
MIEQRETVSDDGVGLFIDQYKDKPRLEALARSFLDSCQELEDVIWSVLLARIIDNAIGKNLDTLGKLVGQPRLGYDDVTYRIFINARALVNRSRGRAQDIIAVAALLLGVYTFSYTDLYPASFVVEADGPVSAGIVAHASAIATLISKARSAGVGSSFHYTDEASAGLLLFSATDSMDIDSPHGLADDTGTTGGTLIGVF